ncbi:MAG: hypothetical protein WCC46_15140, partial [Terriglobales bacterium]
MKLVGLMTAAVLSLTLVAAAPAFAQEQHEQEEQKAKPAQDEKKAQPAKPAQQEDKGAQQKTAKPEEKNARQEKTAKPEEKNAQAKNAQPAQHSGGGRIPDDKYKANFGSGHTFHVSQGDYGNRRFQYGGYSFGFVGAWPGNWLYTQNVFVVDIDG